LQSGSKRELSPLDGNKVEPENVAIHLPGDQPSRDEIALRQESVQRYKIGGGGGSEGVGAEDARARPAVYGAAPPEQQQPYVPPQRLAHFDLKVRLWDSHRRFLKASRDPATCVRKLKRHCLPTSDSQLSEKLGVKVIAYRFLVLNHKGNHTYK